MSSVKQEQIDNLLNNAPYQTAIFWNKEMVRSYQLPNGFTICGRAACVDPSNFDYGIGEKICLDDAKGQLWQLEGYLLQQKLHEQKAENKLE
jgi:hypothetical protein